MRVLKAQAEKQISACGDSSAAPQMLNPEIETAEAQYS
jgi:hypothetical protein